MTSRDIEIVDFLTKYKFATTTMLCSIFFPSIHSCYKTMSRLYKSGKVKRMRMVQDSINSDYVYYTKSVGGHMKHSLSVTWFYYKWQQVYQMDMFEVEYKLGDIVPDAVFVFSKGGVKKAGLLEVELSKKGFNYMKYERFCASGEYKKYFSKMPDIYVLGNATIPTGTRCVYHYYEIDGHLK